MNINFGDSMITIIVIIIREILWLWQCAYKINEDLYTFSTKRADCDARPQCWKSHDDSK